MAVKSLLILLTLAAPVFSGETAYGLFSIGNHLELAGDDAGAIEFYHRALALDPTATAVYLSLANAYYRQHDFDRGIAWAGKALDFSADEKILITIGTGYIGKADLRSAVRFYERAAAAKPGDLEIAGAVATLYEALGDASRARAVMLAVPAELKSADVYNRIAEISGRMNDHVSAVDFYRQALALDPDNATAVMGMATGFDFLENRDSSIAYYERAAAGDTLLAVSKRLVDLYADAGDYQKLIVTARKILAANFYENAVRRSLGYALFKSGGAGDALNEFLIASRLETDDTYSKFYIARIYIEQGKYQEARVELTEALRINPGFIELWIYLGFAAIDLKEYDLAYRALAEAAHRGGDMSQIHYLLGVISELDGRESDAYFYYSKSLTRNADALAALEALANLNDRLGRKSEAYANFRRIITLDTTNAVALNYVAYTMAERAESLDQALLLVEKALAAEPANGYFLDSRGWIYFQQGELTLALDDLKRASELVPDTVILDHLGDVYLKLDDAGNAAETFRRILLIDPGNGTAAKKLKLITNRPDRP